MELFTHGRTRSQNATRGRIVETLWSLEDEGNFLVLRHHRDQVRVAGPYANDTFLVECQTTFRGKRFRGQRGELTRGEIEQMLLAFYSGNTDWCSKLREQAQPKTLLTALALGVAFVFQAVYFLT